MLQPVFLVLCAFPCQPDCTLSSTGLPNLGKVAVIVCLTTTCISLHPALFLVALLPLQMCVGLVLQLMQSMCDLPDSDADVTAAYKQCHQQFNCVDYFWNGMLNGWVQLPGGHAAQV